MVEQRNLARRFLIVCEGTATEPNYFYGLSKSTDRKKFFIKIVPAGRVTLSLVKEAVKLKEEDEEYDEVWCVFDRDFKAESKNQQNFNAAITLAQKEGIKLAISNDAFELWYLLHFEYYSSATHRSNLRKMLSVKSRLGEKYEKNCEDMYEKLKDGKETAIANAKRLWESNDIPLSDNSPGELIRKHNQNPSTTVHLLVEELSQYIE
ncbi:MAG: RloB family protein [Cyanobacteriota bacterium]|nr:RloB family protein [Cyanobacteriota bacterium]